MRLFSDSALKLLLKSQKNQENSLNLFYLVLGPEEGHIETHLQQIHPMLLPNTISLKNTKQQH